jgi:hypothetical protein
MFAFLLAAPRTRANAGASAPFPKLKDMAGGNAPGDDRGEHGALEAIVSLASSFSTHPKVSSGPGCRNVLPDGEFQNIIKNENAAKPLT